MNRIVIGRRLLFRPLIFMVLILVAVGLDASGKKGYVQGYIITLEGDTLSGQIQDRAPGTMANLYTQVRFVPEGKCRSRKYGPNQIRGYGYEGARFRSVPLREETDMLKIRYYTDAYTPMVFLKVIREAPCLVHYEKEFMYDDNFVIDAYPLFHKPGSTEMVRVTQGVLGLKKQRLTEYFDDDRALLSAIDKREVREVNEVFDFYTRRCPD